MQLSDAQLLQNCRRGDEFAWESLVLRYQKLIYAIPRRAGLDNDQAAEVFQEVFTTLFSKLDAIEEPDRLHAWLVTTARRKTWKLIEKQKSWQEISGELDDDGPSELANIAAKGILPDEALIELEQQHEIRTVLASLDERCRRLIELLFYTDAPPAYSEVARQLSVPEGSIGPTRARCLGKMFRLLQKS